MEPPKVVEETIVVVVGSGGVDGNGHVSSSSEPQDLPELSQGPPETVLAMGDFPLEGLKNEKGPLEGAESTTSSSDSSNWLPVPEAICVYHQRGACLRLNCRYFHGTVEQLAELQATGATHYRFDTHSRVEVPKPGEDVPELADPGIGIRFQDDGGKKRKKPIVCLAFLSGTCRRPDCRFTHLPPNVRPLPTTACAYFSVGTCKRGTCRYFHGTEDDLARLKAQGATMYNPLTNEPYERIPDFDEPQRPDSRASSSSGGSASGDGRRGHHAQKKQQPPTYQLVVPAPPQQAHPQQPPPSSPQIIYVTQQPAPYQPQPGMMMMGPQLVPQPLYHQVPAPMPMYAPMHPAGFHPGVAVAAPAPMAFQPGMPYFAQQQNPMWVTPQPVPVPQQPFIMTHPLPYQ